MNIDMTIDYDKLLEEAKKRCEKFLKLDTEATNLFINSASIDEYLSAGEKLRSVRNEYRDWEKNNIDKLGVSLITSLENGIPIGIKAVIAGHDNYFPGHT